MPVTTTTTIRNDTPHPLKLSGADDRSLSLAPLESRRLPTDDLSGFDLAEATLSGQVSVWTEPPLELAERLLGAAIALGFVLTIACAIASGLGERVDRILQKEVVWSAGAMAWILGMAGVVIYHTRRFGLVVRFVSQMLSLLVILAIGLGLPAAAVYYFGEGKTLLGNPPSPELFTRLLQVGFIAAGSLMPTLLFFLFDRYQLSTVRERLYRDLFRLDRGLRTRSEIDARYGSQIREAYGPEDQGKGRLAPGTRWPVLVCAIVMTVGWLAVFNPVGPVTPAEIQNPLVPRQTALTFGFIGAYFFGLQMIARRYSRGDLKPKTYGYITIRILSVAVLSWVLEVIFGADSTVKLLCAFLTGILPDEFFTLVREKFRGVGPDQLVPESEKHPLTRLEGIDLYDRARLEQEGIVNVESLAHHEFIQLVLETQVPVPRLVDWMDQAILYLHVTADPASKDAVPAGATLRRYGIRTTTDLLSCWDAAIERKEIEEFRDLLGKDGKPHRLEVMRDALLDDEWLDRVKDWRNDADRPEIRIQAVPTTFEGKLVYADRLETEARYKDAIQTVNEALEIRDTAEARLQLARLLTSSPVLSLRDPVQARDNARRAFDLGQNDVETLKGLIPILEATSDSEYAIRATDTVIRLLGEPKDDESRELLKAMKKKRAELELNRPSLSATAGRSPAGG